MGRHSIADEQNHEYQKNVRDTDGWKEKPWKPQENNIMRKDSVRKIQKYV